MLTIRTHTRVCALLCALLMLPIVTGCSCTPTAERRAAPSAAPEPAVEPEPESAPETGERAVLIFLMSPSGVSPAGRTLEVELAEGALPADDAPATLEPLVRALLEGPSAAERHQGLTTPIPSET